MDKKQIQKNDPFLLRAIEYWIDSCNELTYQPMFCELLINDGYTLKYSIKNNSLEQGKDVVAVNDQGMPCAYQLKGGNITLTRWGQEVRPEIDQLIECPIKHPGVDKAKGHISYLITNGEIDDSVRVLIDDLNQGKWKDTPLQVIKRGDLLRSFQDMVGGILPESAEAYKKLMDLIFIDGTGLPDLEHVSMFLSGILNISDTKRKKEQRRRDIAAAILYTSMIVGAYRKMKNYGATVRTLIVLMSLIFYLVDKYDLEDKYWLQSYEVIWHDILANSKFLELEMNDTELQQHTSDPLFNELLKFRKHSAVSIIYPYKLAQLIEQNNDWKLFLENYPKSYTGAIAIFGEASFVQVILLAYLINQVDSEAAAKLIKGALDSIILFNGRNSKTEVGLLPPCFDFDFAIKKNLGLLDDEFDYKFKSFSHLAKPLLEILVRLDRRDLIASIWQELSFLRFEEFIPDNKEDYYLRRIEKGENFTSIPDKEQSWKKLVEKASTLHQEALPTTLKRFPAFLPFFLSIYPHRTNSSVIGYLDHILKVK